jgi:two-component system chemotaxis response regulator CheY
VIEALISALPDQNKGAAIKPTILIVEDSTTTAHLQAFVLKARDLEVDTVHDGVEALERLHQDPEKFDLLVADLKMPKMDGLTLIRKLRQQEAFRDFPIIIVTSMHDEETKKEGLRAGANLYLLKPIQPETLVAHIKMLLGETAV